MRLNLVFFFEKAHGYLNVRDPADYSGNLADPLTRDQQNRIKQSFAHALEHARSAQAADENGDVAEALRQWRIIFGDEFPSCGPSPAKLRLKRPT